MAWHDSSARSRELGVQLRSWRERAGLKGIDLAAKLGWSPTKVSRAESGMVALTEVDAARYLTFCGIDNVELDRLLDLVRAPDTGSWLQEHGTRLPEELRTLVYHETNALSMAGFEPMLVHGLLQTRDYAWAVFEAAGRVGSDKIEMAVQARMARQDVLKRIDPPTCRFFLHENGLRSKVGSNKIMVEQLLQLVFLTSRPQHEIRVVPASAGVHGALSTFMVMDYATHNPVVYLEFLAQSLFLEKPEHIGSYREALKRLDHAALDTEQSRKWLAHLASDFDQPEVRA